MKTEELVKLDIHGEVNSNELIKCLKSSCSDAFNAYLSGDIVIYRGQHHIQKTGIINPQVGHRKSVNISNYYTTIMSQSPEFCNFPPRDKSLICSTSIEDAAEFGTVHAVFPINGTEIGIANKYDIWEISKSYFNGASLENITKMFDGYFHGVCFDDYHDQLKYEADNHLGNKYSSFLKKFTPKNLDISHMNTKTFYKNFHNHKSEVWFSNTAYVGLVNKNGLIYI